MAEINEFDDYLKDALSNLGENIAPGDWDSFAEKLNIADGASPPEETTGFDDLIRDRMEGLEINADANYWEVMESKIDQEINVPKISDEALDQLAADNLSNLYIPYNPTHWTLLSHRLEEEFNVRRKIVSYKLVEFSLMVLLLLTIVQFMPYYSTNTPVKNNTPDKTQVSLIEEVNLDLFSSENTTRPAGQADLRIAAINSKVATAAKTGKKINSVVIGNQATHPKHLPEMTIIPNRKKSISSVTSTIPTPSEIASNQTIKAITAKKENARNSIVYEDALVTNRAALALTELPVAISKLDHYSDWSAIGLFKKFPKKVLVRLGAMTSADLNYIKTPSTSRYKNNGYQQYQLGYGGGIVLDLNYEKLTLSTGLIYRRINYYPQEDKNFTGAFPNIQSHIFDAVNLNLLTIPMNLQFQVNNVDKKWKLHAVTGASLNVLALNHYNITVNNLGNNTSRSIGPSPQVSPEENTPDEIFREADIAGEGLFEGGTFERNHYFTANFGLGVERFISPRWSLFIQPVYQHEIFRKNLGLNRDRIHTFSVQIGAKSTFK